MNYLYRYFFFNSSDYKNFDHHIDNLKNQQEFYLTGLNQPGDSIVTNKTMLRRMIIMNRRDIVAKLIKKYYHEI